ncbi:MAG: putative tricarboxylic transport rane protein [Solirubrobacteraceae bacterium]|nr:putative tricarboxylic transport rane protein [Solirubrobacteraceae bacterium]
MAAVAAGCGADEKSGGGGGGGAAANFPNKELHLIVQAKPGGTSDLVARTVAKDVEKQLGQKIVVENKPGASGSIAMNFVASQRPDGYTIGYLPVEMTMLQYLGYENVKPERYSLIAQANSVPSVLTVNADSPHKTLDDFIQAAKKKQFSVGNSGPGSIWHAATGAVEQAAGVKLRPVPFDGGAPAVVALLGNKIDATTVGVPEILSGVKSGKLRALAVLADERNVQLPDVPTAKEAGLDTVITAWGGFGAPKGTPQPVVDKLATAFKAAISKPSFQQAMKNQGVQALYRDPEAFTTYANEQSQQFSQIVPKLGVKQ